VRPLFLVKALDEWAYRVKSLARYRRDIQQRFDRSVEQGLPGRRCEEAHRYRPGTVALREIRATRSPPSW
jgi:hypothetical protein